MHPTERLVALEADLQLRRRTIMFLVAEYATRNDGQHAKIIAFLKEIIPDMDGNAAAIAQEILDELYKA